MIEVTFTAAIEPEPQGSISSFIIEGKLDVRAPCDRNGKPNWERKPRVVSTSDNEDLSYFRDFVGYECKSALNRRGSAAPLAAKHEPVELIVEFVFVRPKTVDAGREMVVRPDIDKLQRALYDGMAGILYHDDAQVVAVTCRKRYGPRAEVKVRAAVIRDATLFDALLHDAVRQDVPKPRNTKAPARSGAGALRVRRVQDRPKDPAITVSDRKKRVSRVPV